MSVKPLKATTAGQNKLGLCDVLQAYVDDQWTADHYTDKQRCEILLEQFKRAVEVEMKLLEVTVGGSHDRNE